MQFYWKNNSPDGCILEVDLEYSDELHELHNDYPLAPEKLKIRYNMLSNYFSNIENDYRIKIVSVNPIQNGEEERLPLPVFPLQLLKMQQLSPKIFWLLVFTIFLHWCKISSFYLVLPILEPIPPLKKDVFFCSNPYKV